MAAGVKVPPDRRSGPDTTPGRPNVEMPSPGTTTDTATVQRRRDAVAALRRLSPRDRDRILRRLDALRDLDRLLREPGSLRWPVYDVDTLGLTCGHGPGCPGGGRKHLRAAS